MRNFNFIKYSKIFFTFSGILILASLLSLIFFGLKLGIEFSGGSILEVEFKTTRPSNLEVLERLKDLELGEILIQPANDQGMILRVKNIDEDTHQKILEKLKGISDLEEKRFESIGPTIGRELRQKTKLMVILASLTLILYITIAFWKVSRPVKSWQYSLVSLLVLGHDILIPLGIFSVLGNFWGVQITIPVLVALLTVLGYSINNTIVVFDRIRENLLKRLGDSFEEIVNFSLNQTLTRCINTSLTTLFTLLAIFFFGGETLKYFSLALILGISFGTYSSLFLGSPILVTLFKWQKKK